MKQAKNLSFWENAKEYSYEEGFLFLGRDEKNKFDVGIPAKRHAITFGGSGAGKGVTILTPNLLRNSDKNTLVIDPKGELAKRTAVVRESMQQKVFVIDPFKRSGVDNRFIASYNPLDDLYLNSISIGEDIGIIADGIVMRHDPKHARWDNNAQIIIAGLIAFVKTQMDERHQNLIEVRRILRREDMIIIAEKMHELSGCGGLMQAAAQTIMSESGEQFLETARDNTIWLDNEAMKHVLTNSSFSLADLKNKKISIFLVLPPEYLKAHGRFLRLFVRCSLSQMQRLTPEGNERGETCLFLLDEFFSLGKIDEIVTSVGQMRSMGLILWPFLQDLGQLMQLYGKDTYNTFFANSDVHQFFGATDPITLGHISETIGRTVIDEIRDAPSAVIGGGGGQIISGAMIGSKDGATRFLGGVLGAMSSTSAGMSQSIYQDEMQKYQREMSQLGQLRVPPDEVARLT